jgi:hypothetical protein
VAWETWAAGETGCPAGWVGPAAAAGWLGLLDLVATRAQPPSAATVITAAMDIRT